MANSAFYEAKLKAKRWVEPVVLGVRDISALSRDMAFVIRTLEEASAEIARLKLSNAALRQERVPPSRKASVVVMDTRRLALQIAEKVADGPLAVYRGPRGGIAWCPPTQEMDGDLIGVWDAGADWRDIHANLEAA